MKAHWVVTLLTLLLGLQPATTDLYLPAMPSMTQALAAPISAVQLTLSSLIMAFGAGQLIWGPLSDRYGRKPVLTAGLALYVVASLGSMLAPHIEALIAWRVVQGLAMAAAVTCARSIVRDLYDPHEGAQVLSRGLTGLGVIAMGTPLVGAVLAQSENWRAAFAALALFGGLALSFVLVRMSETLPARNPRATRLGPLLANWAEILLNPGFLAWTALLAATYGGLYVYLAASSFVYMKALGVDVLTYGLLLALNSAAFIVGTFWCRRLLATRGLARAVRIGGTMSATGGLLMAGLALAGWASVWTILLPQMVFAVAHGINQPCAQAGSIGPFPEKAGTAASLSGFCMMVVAFGVGLWLGQALDGTVMPLALGLGFFGTLCGALAWTLVRWHGEPPARAMTSASA